MRVFKPGVVNRIPKLPVGKAHCGGHPITQQQTKACSQSPLAGGEETQTPSCWTNGEWGGHGGTGHRS